MKEKEERLLIKKIKNEEKVTSVANIVGYSSAFIGGLSILLSTCYFGLMETYHSSLSPELRCLQYILTIGGFGLGSNLIENSRNSFKFADEIKERIRDNNEDYSHLK